MRHHRRADDADRKVEQFRVGEDALIRHQAAGERRAIGRRHQEDDAETGGDHDDKADHHRFQAAQPLVLQVQDQDRVGAREQHSRNERQPEQQVQRHGDADQLGKVAGHDAELGEQPERQRNRLRVVLAAAGSEILAAADAEPGREDLQRHRHQAREQYHREQQVAVT